MGFVLKNGVDPNLEFGQSRSGAGLRNLQGQLRETLVQRHFHSWYLSPIRAYRAKFRVLAFSGGRGYTAL